MANKEQLALLSKITGCPVAVGPQKLAKVLLSLNDKTLADRTDDPEGAIAIAGAIASGSVPQPEPAQEEPPESTESNEAEDAGEGDADGDGEENADGDGEENASGEDGEAGGETLSLDQLEQMTKKELQETAIKLGLAQSGNVKAIFNRIKSFLDL